MIKNYVKNKKVRAALSIETEMMQRVPEVSAQSLLFEMALAQSSFFFDPR
jgi:hypothetical protein